MSLIKAMLDDVVFAFSRSRQVGHSKTAIEAVKATEGARLVVSGIRLAKDWSKRYGIKAVTVADLSPFPGEGVLIFDNHAIVELCKMAVNEIDGLQKQNRDMARKLRIIKETLDA